MSIDKISSKYTGNIVMIILGISFTIISISQLINISINGLLWITWLVVLLATTIQTQIGISSVICIKMINDNHKNFSMRMSLYKIISITLEELDSDKIGGYDKIRNIAQHAINEYSYYLSDNDENDL